MGKIAPITIDQCIERLKDNATDMTYCEIEGLLTWSKKYLEYQQTLLKNLYNSASKIDLEYCTILNNYDLVPFDKNEIPYHISEEYDDVWMEDFIAVEEHLGIY